MTDPFGTSNKYDLNYIRVRMLRFDLVSLRGLKLGRPVSAVWFDSNAIEMTTPEHYMYLTKFCELLACHSYCSGELKFMLETYTFVLLF